MNDIEMDGCVRGRIYCTSYGRKLDVSTRTRRSTAHSPPGVWQEHPIGALQTDTSGVLGETFIRYFLAAALKRACALICTRLSYLYGYHITSYLHTAVRYRATPAESSLSLMSMISSRAVCGHRNGVAFGAGVGVAGATLAPGVEGSACPPFISTSIALQWKAVLVAPRERAASSVAEPLTVASL